MVQKLAGTIRLLCQPSSKWASFFESGKEKAAKGEGWAPPFIRFSLGKVGL